VSNEIKRVPPDFSWPIGQVWEGFLSPDKFDEVPCGSCIYEKPPSILDELFGAPARSGTGYSPHGQYLHDLWYGTVTAWDPEHLPFHPERYGSRLLTPATPAVRRFAERNVANAPDFYGTGEAAIIREGQRLANLWNGMWCHHLNQADVDALIAAARLVDFTHRWSKEDGWLEIEPPVRPAPEQVNEWSMSGMGHDSLNAWIAVEARCKREGFDPRCPACEGHGSLEAYPGQRAEAEAWKPEEPPMGTGWQLWETVSEGSPASPVFAAADELASWMSDPERGDRWVPADVAAKFIETGWAPTLMSGHDGAPVSGIEAVGFQEEASPDDH